MASTLVFHVKHKGRQMDQQAFRQIDDLNEWTHSVPTHEAYALMHRFHRVLRSLPYSERSRFVYATHRHVSRQRFSALARHLDEFLIEWEALV